MALVKPDVARFAKIKVLGVGGGGGNVVNTMIADSQIQGVDFIAVNTDAQALLNNLAPTKLQIGDKITRGLGVGGNPEIGSQAADESREKIAQYLVDTDMVFITGGMGGGTATGASPVIAEVARENGALTVAVVTKPFAFEGTRRMIAAEEGIERLHDKVDALIVIPNQKLIDSVDKKMTLVEAFRLADSVLSQGVQGISDIITLPGLINRDFADIKTIMKDAGSAFMGIGVGMGENRAQAAARAAIASPLLEISIDGAKGILFTITGGSELTMNEVNEASKIISEKADADANIIFGATVDEKMGDQVKITVIATGFDELRSKFSQFVSTPVTINSTGASQLIEDQPQEEQQTDQSSDNPPQNFPSQENNTGNETSGDEFDIPAFLRQGR